jgi:putative pyruvate formate lyase activating enzyme
LAANCPIYLLENMLQPSYIGLYRSGELEKRAASMQGRLSNCDICPRKCNVNRMESDKGFCRSGRLVSISSYCDHHGEEPALSGSKGSGTIFFNNCNLKCTYCQNYQISQGPDSRKAELKSNELAGIMLHLQNTLGCHNINLVSPSHFVPQIVEATLQAVQMGLKIPLVYNTNAYDSLETLKMLDGIIDIYLPDIKYASDKWAFKFSGAKSYVSTSRQAIAEMFRQVGDLVTDAEGLAQRGLIVRHLILPNGIAGSEDSLKWLAEKVSRNTTVSIMAQYYPSHLAVHDPLLSRKINSKEYNQVVALIEELGLENGWLQEMDSAEFYLPDFDSKGHPFE